MVVRPEDLLVVGFDFYDLGVDHDGGIRHLVARAPEPVAPPGTSPPPEEPIPHPVIVVRFQPQNLAEQAFWEDSEQYKPRDDDPDKAATQATEPKPKPSIPVGILSAGISRLAFDVPAEFLPVEYRLPNLLELLSKLEPRVVPAALPPDAGVAPTLGCVAESVAPVMTNAAELASGLLGDRRTVRPGRGLLGRLVRTEPVGSIVLGLPPELREPNPLETALELPFRLFLSPPKGAQWLHSPTPRALASDRTELWHTRLALPDPARPERQRPPASVRAVWARRSRQEQPRIRRQRLHPGPPAPDHDEDHNDPFRTSLDPFDRWAIVNNSANFGLRTNEGGPRYQPLAIDTELLALSSLGAWTNLHGAWSPRPEGISLEEWRHRAAQGRDHYVRVVYAGYLFPFGHRASLVKVTERRFHYPREEPENPDYEGQPAFLRQRMFIIVRRPEMVFDEGLSTSRGRQMPFRSVRIKTLVTPNLASPGTAPIKGSGTDAQNAFWPQLAPGDDFHFHFVAEDFAGQTVDLSMPLAFIDAAWAVDKQGGCLFFGSVHNIVSLAITDYINSPRSSVDVAGAPAGLRGAPGLRHDP